MQVWKFIIATQALWGSLITVLVIYYLVWAWSKRAVKDAKRAHDQRTTSRMEWGYPQESENISYH